MICAPFLETGAEATELYDVQLRWCNGRPISRCNIKNGSCSPSANDGLPVLAADADGNADGCRWCKGFRSKTPPWPWLDLIWIHRTRTTPTINQAWRTEWGKATSEKQRSTIPVTGHPEAARQEHFKGGHAACLAVPAACVIASIAADASPG